MAEAMDIPLDDSVTPEDPETDFEFVEFDPKWKDDLIGMMYVGKKLRPFSYLGHEIIIKTPNIEDMLQIGMLHKQYFDSEISLKAWQALMAAISIVSIDGKPLTIPIGEDENSVVSRFNYIIRNWYPWTVDAIFVQTMLLDRDIQMTISAMMESSGFKDDDGSVA